MVTLEQIYDRLDTGAADTKMTSFTEPSSGPGTGTMHSLDEILAIAPAADQANGAAPGDVLNGKTYWGLRTNGMWGQQTGTLPNAVVPKTGETYPFADGADGHLQKGVAWPVPRFTLHDNGTSTTVDDTVTDNLTGLMWSRNANHGAMKWVDGSDFPALAYCTNLELGNYRDWRLPNVRELHSLMDFSQSNPALPDGHFFLGVESNLYWTSSSFIFFSLEAWYVSLWTGKVDHDDKSFEYYVWPVRGGQ
jgi:hypothetical protein